MMTSTEILNEINEKHAEHLEMMSIEEKFILITHNLALKLAMEMADKDHYKKCFFDALKLGTTRINS